MKKIVIRLVCLMLIMLTSVCSAEDYIEIAGGRTMESAPILIEEQLGHVVISKINNRGKKNKDRQSESWHRIDVLRDGNCVIRVKYYEDVCWFDLMDRNGNRLERVPLGTSGDGQSWKTFTIDGKQGDYYYLHVAPSNGFSSEWGYIFSVCTDSRHQLGSIELVIAEPTCINNGIKGYRCELCQTDIASESLPAKGHEIGAEIIIREATCLQTGEKGKMCKICGEKLSSAEIPIQSHTPGAYVDVQKATCTADGVRAQYCQVCNATLNTEKVLALGHQSGEWRTAVSESCYQAGRREKNCTICGAVLAVEEIPQEEHQYSEWKTILEPTKEAEGEEGRICILCGDMQFNTIPKVAKFLGIF